jgi:hypothetical protein
MAHCRKEEMKSIREWYAKEGFIQHLLGGDIAAGRWMAINATATTYLILAAAALLALSFIAR